VLSLVTNDAVQCNAMHVRLYGKSRSVCRLGKMFLEPFEGEQTSKWGSSGIIIKHYKADIPNAFYSLISSSLTVTCPMFDVCSLILHF
jgi:hypothetical protein